MDGKIIPGCVDFGLEIVDGEKIAVIPQFYLDDHKWLRGEKGEQLDPKQCEDFFCERAKKVGLVGLKIVTNDEWLFVNSYQNLY